MQSYRRLDRAVARAESAAAVVTLLSMVLVASAQALFFNLAERDIAWAQAILEGLSWVDTFLQKGTLWVAFLGASLATHQDKHVAIDVVPKLVAPALRSVMRCFASLGAGLIALVLAAVFYQACIVADASVPFDYAVLTASGPAHICDVDVAATAGAATRPAVLCALRSALAGVGVPISSGAGIAQLIAPLMFVVIGLRLLSRALITGVWLARGHDAYDPEQASEDR